MNYSELDIQEKIVLKVRLLNDLTFFIRFFMKEIEGKKFILNWHHHKIAESLMKVYNFEIQNLIINLPPRHSKTTMVAYFIAWSIAKNPQSMFMYISGSDKLTNSNSRLVRSIILSQQFRELFDVELTVDSTAKNFWLTKQGGGISASTISGQITGFGAGILGEKVFSGAIIIDDPNKINADGSIILSEVPSERFNDTIRSRRNGIRTPIIVIQQRCFINDLTGYLLSEKEPLKFALLKIPVRDKSGKLCWSGKIDDNEMKQLEKLQPEIYDTQYMQEPNENKNKLFPECELNRYDKLSDNKPFAKLAVIDPATNGTNKFSMPIMYIFIDNGTYKCYLEDVYYTDEGIEITQPGAASKIHEHKPNTVLIETNASGIFFKNNLIKLCPNTPIAGKNEQTNKEQRIIFQSGFIKSNFFFKRKYEYGSMYHKFMQCLTRYIKNLPNQDDDAPDSLALMSFYIRSLYNL